MASGAAARRLKKEYTTLLKDPAPGAIARPLETNYLHAHFLLSGEIFYDTPFEGGVYHGVLKFPNNYPMKPPSVIIRTPSGRFQPERKICFSLSDFHPELWNPMWSIRTILTGLVSFMNSEEMTTGGLATSSVIKANLAKHSLQFCFDKDPLAREVFEEELVAMVEERAVLGESWPPKRPVLLSQINESKSTSTLHVKSPGKGRKLDGHVGKAALSGKNAAKNRKKRERGKRKKVAEKFLSTLLEQVPDFLRAIQVGLKEEHDVDVSEYHADHVCWRVESIEEYREIVMALRYNTDNFTLLIESEVKGRSITTFRLVESIIVDNGTVDVVEIPAPKDGSPYKTGLEHVEFVISGGFLPLCPMNDDPDLSVLDEFVRRHPNVEFNVKGRCKEINPHVSMKLILGSFGICAAKFHLISLSKVIEYEKNVT